MLVECPMMNRETNRKTGLYISPASVIVSKLPPPSMGDIWWLQEPPNGNLGSAIRVTIETGGLDSTRSNVIFWPCLSISRQVLCPFWSGNSSNERTSGRQVGGPLIVSHRTAGGCRNLPLRETTCFFGSIAPTIITIAAIATTTATASNIHFIA